MAETKNNSKKLPVILWVSIVIAAVVICAFFVCRTSDTQAVSDEAAVEKTPATPTSFRPEELAVLTGRWVRMDTPYVIEVKSIGDGTLEAAYYNPRPINVSRTEVREKDGKKELFVELSDVNYAGSNYILTYDPANDTLVGVYFHAGTGSNYNIAFRRMDKR